MQWVGFLLALMLGTSLYWNFQSIQDQNKQNKLVALQAEKIASLEKKLNQQPECEQRVTHLEDHRLKDLKKELRFQTNILNSLSSTVARKREPSSIEPFDSASLEEDLKKQRDTLEILSQERNTLENELKQSWAQHKTTLALMKTDEQAAVQTSESKIKAQSQLIRSEIEIAKNPKPKPFDAIVRPTEPKNNVEELKGTLELLKEEKHQIEQTFLTQKDALIAEFQKNQEELRIAVRQNEERLLTERAIFQLLLSESRGMKQRSNEQRIELDKFNQAISKQQTKVQNLEKKIKFEELKSRHPSS